MSKLPSWDEWKGTFLISRPFKYTVLSHRWPVIKWIQDAGLNRDSRILEVGCGGGSMGLFFAVRRFNVVFSDVSGAMLEDCRRNIRRARRFFPYLEGGLARQDVFQLGFKDSIFDLVITDGMYEHFIDKEIRKMAVSEMMRVTRDQGHVIISIPNNHHPFLNWWKARGHDYMNPEHKYREIVISAQDFKEEIESFGLRDVVVDGWKVYESMYYKRGLTMKLAGNIARCILPCFGRALRVKLGMALYATGKVCKQRINEE